MKSVFLMALLMAAIVVGLPACGQRDREEAKKTSDGSDTFVYTKPDLKKYAKSAPKSDKPEKVTEADIATKSIDQTNAVTPVENDKKE